MKKGNLVLAAICAVLGVGIIAVASGYPKAADYGTGVPGPGSRPVAHRHLNRPSGLHGHPDLPHPENEAGKGHKN